MPHRLDSLLRPRSIAVLGATERAGTVGRHTVENLLKGGYQGRMHAVNPGHDAVCGVPWWIAWVLRRCCGAAATAARSPSMISAGLPRGSRHWSQVSATCSARST